MKKLLLSLFLIMHFQLLLAQQVPAVEINKQFPGDLNGLNVKTLDSSDIYPTLVEDFIVIKRNVNTRVIQVRIEDATGIIYFDKQLEGNRKIDVSDFKAGTYIIKIAAPGEITIGQFVKR